MSDEAPRQAPAGRGFSVSYKGKTLLSAIDPIAQAERLAQTAPVLERTLYLCPSPLYGYGLEALLARASPESAVLCVEADQRLLALSMQAMAELLEANAPVLGLVGSADPALVCGYVRKTWGSRRFRRVEPIRLSGGWRLFPGLYDALADALRRDFASDWGNAMTLTKLGRRYILNAVRNLAFLPKAMALQALHFGNAPILVLGAGPSLDALLDQADFFSSPAGVRSFKIICVDTALPALKERNIKPDLAVALESQHWNVKDFLGLGDWEVPIAMDLSALPATRETLGGKIAFFATLWTELRLFRRLSAAGLLPEVFPPLGSVGLTAVTAALRLSSGPVIISGLDFSYTLDSFHARSAPSHSEGLRRQTRLRSRFNGEAAFQAGTVSGVSKSGGQVRTNPALKLYRDLFEQTFAGESRILDITGPGLSLGVPTVSLEEARRILQSGASPKKSRPEEPQKPSAAAVEAFIRRERDALIALRDMMTGIIPGDAAVLETLLDEADYLWSHFPDCAGAGGRRPSGRDISFLKRVRAEIDPLIRSFDMALAELLSLNDG
ncbi:MAG: DUF115 domain-containing protein [Spirochaetaceae bacterium]|jgi:hypothetical protein|nr:DUF115 domain-containing protein [Spirochaetaceae bacterium]